MKIIKLLNKQREAMGQIHWMPPDQIQVNVPDPSLLGDLNNLIADARENGLLLRGGGRSENEGQKVFVETAEQIKADDERFLKALADTIGQRRFGDQRIFCLVKEVEAPNADV
ncbi:MAG: hypothetical protein WA902_06005 [Thermosynechococcaceae cyanobacterium]